MAEYKDTDCVVILGGKALSLKKSVYPTVKALVAGLLAGGMTEDKIKALIPAESFDSDGQKALETEKLCAEASKLLTPAVIQEAKDLLSTLDVLDDSWQETMNVYNVKVEEWKATEDGRKLEQAEQAVSAAIAARDAVKTEVQASASYKALGSIETELSVKAGKLDEAKSAVTTLRRKVTGEDEKFDKLALTLDDKGNVGFSDSGKRKARAHVTHTDGTPGKGSSLTATKDGQTQTFASAAEALRKLDPAFVSSKGANFSRAAIIAHLGKAGYTCS